MAPRTERARLKVEQRRRLTIFFNKQPASARPTR